MFMKYLKTFETSHEDDLLVNGSGLFFWKSHLPKEKQLEIVKWYKALPEKDREIVDILRSESSDEAYWNSQDEYSDT